MTSKPGALPHGGWKNSRSLREVRLGDEDPNLERDLCKRRTSTAMSPPGTF